MSNVTNHNDPFATSMIFLRIGWMTRYQGQTANDHITGGGAFVVEHGYGHEIFNFQPFEGQLFGYVQPPGSGHNQPAGPGININRLGARNSDDSISGVSAIWIATAPQGGSYIVGWYSNATIHRHWQKPPAGAERQHAGDKFGFYVSAPQNDAILLPPDERLFEVPRGLGGMGQANVWYADNHEQHRQVRTDVLSFVETRRLPGSSSGSGSGTPRQINPFLRQEVERKAIATTTEYYSKLGYEVDSVESDNVGWDLNAIHGKRQLKLEVKGLSGMQLRVELTPNEYDKMKAHHGSYRVCVVTNALLSPELAVFAFSQETQRWEDQYGRVLQIEEFVAARCRT